MAGRPAARITDNTMHPLPGILTPGPGSFNVIIGNLLAWRGIPAAAAAGLQAAKQASDTVIKTAEAATVAAAGTPAAPAAYAAEQTAKTTAAAALGSAINAAAAASATPSGGMPDIHACLTPAPVPPHGPGVVIDGSPTVLINGLPACRQGDTILEPLGPPNKIMKGEFTVLIGNGAGGAGGAGASGGGVAGAKAPSKAKLGPKSSSSGSSSSGAAGAAASGAGGTAAAPAPGSPSAQTFPNQDGAALAALNDANPQSIAANQEFGGLVYKNADGTYGYTTPKGGGGASFDPTSVSAPPGATVVGDYHTHGDYSTADASGNPVRTNDPSKDAFNSDNFSQADLRGIRHDAAGNPDYRGYLGTPSGTFKEFDPNTNTVRNIP